MSKDIGTIRELSASELDLVGGGLSVGASAGVAVDASSELAAVSGLVGKVGGLVKSLAGTALGAVGAVGGSV